MIKFKIYPNYTYAEQIGEVTQEDTQIKNVINNLGLYEYTQFFASRGQTPEAVEMSYNIFTWQKFPSSLFFRLEKILGNFTLEADIKIFPEELKGIPYSFPFDFYEKQEQAILKGIENKRGYFNVRTGGGKTAIMIALSGELGGNSLIIEPSIDLVEQVAQEYEASMEIKVARIVGRKSLENTIRTPIVVASIDTLNANFDELVELGWLTQFNNILFDEVHHANFVKPTNKRKTSNGRTTWVSTPANMTAYYKVGMACTANNRFGFTSTPKGKELFIECITGPELITITEDELIELGRLAKPTYLIYKIPLKFEALFTKAKKNQLLNNPERNRVILSLAEHIASLGKTVLVLIDSLKYQLKYFEDHCDHFYSIGKTKIEERSELYKKLKDKEIKILISSVIREGVNIPSIDCVLRAAGNLSEGKVTQETGRGKRVTFEKDTALFIDFFDDDGSQKVCKNGRWRTKVGHLRKHSESRIEEFSSSEHATLKIFDDLTEMKLAINEFFNK